MLNRPAETSRFEWQGQSNSPAWRRFLIGESPAIAELCEVVKLIASKRITVLISGETGTGKEVVARAIHAASQRNTSPLVAVNCTALPASLVESELFGHAKGAFTGAHLSRVGRFEQAHRGTIFLDEIGDLPLEAQSKLLRVLQEQEFERVGSSETVKVDVRVIAASNVDLEKAVADRRFREDLYYRLNVVPIHLIPLRERRSDIPLLVQYFLDKTRAAEGGVLKEVSSSAFDYLMSQQWPGNIRQLEHTIQMACALSGDREVLEAADFIARGRTAGQAAEAPAAPSGNRPFVTVGEQGIDFDRVVAEFERSLLQQALTVSGGNKARAADLLRIKRTTLLAKIKVFEAANLPVALLVAEDDSSRKQLAHTLERDGYRVLEADTPETALEHLEAWKTALKLVVCSSPEFARECQRLQPALQTIVLPTGDLLSSQDALPAGLLSSLTNTLTNSLTHSLVTMGAAVNSLCNVPESQFLCA